MSTEKIIGQGTSFEFREPPGRVEGPVTLEDCEAVIGKITFRRGAYIHRWKNPPSVLVLSNRQFYALRKFGRQSFAVQPTRYGHNEFLQMKIIVDARGDYPDTPLVGHIEF